MDLDTSKLIDGNRVAESIYEELRAEIAELSGRAPRVVFIRVGEDPASRFYVSKKKKIALSIGAESDIVILPETITEEELIVKVKEFNKDDGTDGILVQAPLPKGISEANVFNSIDPKKDVDGFNVLNSGLLVQEDLESFAPCTPQGILELLKREKIETTGKHVVVIGRSLIVGKPMALLLARKHPQGNATVTICHSRSENLPEITKQADILVSAIGRPATVTADMVKEGAVVIDVGINRVDDPEAKKGYRIVGDVDFEAVVPLVSKITPVPGGVGPMTVATLMQNTLKAYKLRHSR
ncbi:MAG: bifunctional 5,10-methylenetetrahydrofolate dehydrogenase/5,10-methenyltetrahydrofolate cyclohydrolase [Opitutales bacterium]|nr:bifunctional 5,10-methylenetetrahydrofolate dehydrogenase/5,10-methenyltetrahydrofolate cyclohydrolase [Opitutales bacterium]